MLESGTFNFSVSGTGSTTILGQPVGFGVSLTGSTVLADGKGTGKADTWNTFTGSVDGTGTTYNLNAMVGPLGTINYARIKGLCITNTSTAATAKAVTVGAAVSTTCTVTSAAHGYSNGDVVNVTGCTPDAYNGTFAISNVTADTFDYTARSAPGGAMTVFGTVSKIVRLIIDGSVSNPFLGPFGAFTATLGPGESLPLFTGTSGGWNSLSGANNIKLKASSGTCDFALGIVGEGTLS